MAETVRAIIPKPYMRDRKTATLSPMMDRPAANASKPRQPMVGAPLQVKGVPIGPVPQQMGDYAQEGEPHQKYWQILKTNVVFPPQPAVMVPPTQIPSEVVLYNNHLARAICECMACTVIQTKRPHWIEPPSESLVVDQSTTSLGILLPGGLPGPFTEVLRFIVPDRWYMVLEKIGNALEDDVAFQNVEWRIQINDRSHPIQQYLGGGVVMGGVFTAQLGDPANPTKMSMPLIAKYGDVVSLQARSRNGANHTAYARMMGWKYPVQTIEMAGEPCRQTGLVPLWVDGVDDPISPNIT